MLTNTTQTQTTQSGSSEVLPVILKQEVALDDAQSINLNSLNMLKLDSIREMGSSTITTLSKLLSALRQGLDMSMFGFPLLSDDQKDMLIRTILSLIVFLRLVQKRADYVTLATAFTNVVSNLVSPTKVLDYVTVLFSCLGEELRDVWNSYNSVHTDDFESQDSNFSLPTILSSVLLDDGMSKIDRVLQDRLYTVIQLFITKVVGIWFTLQKGLVPEDMNMETLTQLCQTTFSTIGDGNDVITMLYTAINCIAENWDSLIHGNIDCILLGKTESAKFEATCAKIEGMYQIVKAKQSDLLKKEYGHTYESFNQLIIDTLRTGKSYIKTHTGAILAVLKSTVTRLEIIRSELLLAIQRESLKPQPTGIILFGGSNCGKSTVQETLANTMILAHGITPLPGMITAVNYAAKFDSTTTSDSKVTLADDAGNAESREDFSERIIDHVNTQRRPINKAGVDEKGVHFYNNLGHIVSTNDHRMRNIIKSICQESVFRRFPLHIWVKAKPQYRKVRNDENSGFSDEKTKYLTHEERLDAYDFEIYEFRHMVDADDEIEEDIINEDQASAKHVILDGMAFERVDLPSSDIPSLELLKAYVFKRTQELHKQSVKTLATMKTLNEAKSCEICGMTSVYCQCKFESQAKRLGKTDLGDLASMSHERLMNAHTNISKVIKSNDPRIALRAINKNAAVAYHVGNGVGRSAKVISESIPQITGVGLWLIGAFFTALSLNSPVLMTTNFTAMGIIPMFYLKKLFTSEKALIEEEICSRPEILTMLVPETSVLRQQRAKTMFKWLPAIAGAYMVYKFFKKDYRDQDKVYESETNNVPHTNWEFTKDKQNQAPSMSSKAHTTTAADLISKVVSNMAVVIVSIHGGGEKQALSMPIVGNYYLVPTHCLPTEGTYDLTFYPRGVDNNEGKARVPKVSSLDLSEIKGADYTIVRVTSSAPRWNLLRHLPLEAFSKRMGTYVTQNVYGQVTTSKSYISRYTRLGVGVSVTTTTGSVITNAYCAELPKDTTQGQCGSVFVDETRGVVLGFHSAGNKKRAIFSSLTMTDVEAALAKFEGGFQPTSQAKLDIGSQQGFTLQPGDKWMSTIVENSEYNMPIEKHTWINHGIVLKNGNPQEEIPQSPFCKSNYLPAVVAAFGVSKVGPPQEMTADYHKKKAAIDYNTPKQEFASSDIKRAVDDYLKPIIDKIRLMKETTPDLFDEVKRELSLQEALDGIGEQGLTGINNSTSIGWPMSGSKKKYMVMDPIDPNQPLMPRTFDETLYPLEERMAAIRKNAEQGIRSNFIVKTCSKTNELLPISKKKCRPFQAMGTDVLITCRKTFAPMVRFFGANKYLTECMLGINMKSYEAGEFRKFMTTFNEDMCIAGDFKAYDRNMSAQITSAVADIIVRILVEFDYTPSQLQLASALLTEIIYPHMNFYGQVFELANSNPSGQPLTTHMNSIANSLYTRIIFFGLCPDVDDFRSEVKLATYGDDNAMNVSNRLRGKFTHTLMSNLYMDKYGMTYTMDKKDAESVPYQNFDELGFLKQRIVFNEDYDAYVPLLDESSIVKSLHWQKKAKDCDDPPHVQFASKVDSGLREASHYGRKYYDVHAAKIKSIKDANAIALCAMSIPSYDAIVKKNFWAFHPELADTEDTDTETWESQSLDLPVTEHVYAIEDIMPALKFYDYVVFEQVTYMTRYCVGTVDPPNLVMKKFNMFEERSSTRECNVYHLTKDRRFISTLLLFYDIICFDDVYYVATLQAEKLAKKQFSSCKVILRKQDLNHHHR